MGDIIKLKFNHSKTRRKVKYATKAHQEIVLALLARLSASKEHVGLVLGVVAAATLGPVRARLVVVLTDSARSVGASAGAARLGAVDVHVCRILEIFHHIKSGNSI